MIESKLSETQQNKSSLQEAWPPKWFFSFSDLSTLLMTFFIVLATMLALKIPLYVLADEKMQLLLKERTKELEEIRRLTELEKQTLRELEKMETSQIESVVGIEKMKKFEKRIQAYIKEKNLEDFIRVEMGKWKIRVIPLSPFLFRGASDVMKPQARALLDEIAEFTKTYPSRFKIEGHTDNTPIYSRQFASNWELSIARANSIMKYLMEKHDIPVTKIEAIGYGEYRPLVPNDTKERRATNRRVVLELIPEFEKEEI